MSGFSKSKIVSRVPGVALVRGVVLVGVLSSCVVGVSGCADSEVAAQSGKEHSAEVAQSVDVVMSGGYEVGADGKLLSPLRDKEIPAPQRSWESQKYDKAGAEAFARYVVELMPYTWMTGDTSKIEEISHPECDWCRSLIEPVKELQKDGGWAEEISYQIKSVGPAFEIEGHPGIWHVDVKTMRGQVRYYDGSVVQNLPAKTDNFVMQLHFVNGQWLVWSGGTL